MNNEDFIIDENGVLTKYIGSQKDVIIPDGVKAIGKYAFERLELNSVIIPNSVTSIGDSAFYYNQLTSVIIPDSVTEIESCAFCSNKLTSVVIPDSVTKIGHLAFAHNRLTSVSIPDSITAIEDGVFQNNQLTSVMIPNSVTLIGEWAFNNNQLTSVIIPDSITEIESCAFCSNELTNVIIPDSVTKIGHLAFASNKLTSITIPDSITTIDTGVFSDNQLTSVEIPNSVTSIRHKAFQGNQLTNVIIPDSVTEIGDGAFCHNRLINITIPDHVQLLNENIFYFQIGSENASLTITILHQNDCQHFISNLAKCFARTYYIKYARISIIIQGTPLTKEEKRKINELFPQADIFFSPKPITTEVKKDTKKESKAKPTLNETDQLIMKIRELIEPLDDVIEKQINNQIQELMKNYNEQLHSRRPKLSLQEEEIHLDTVADAYGLQRNLIAELEAIITSLQSHETMTNFLKDINNYQTLLEKNIQEPSHLETTVDKILYIIAIAKKLQMPIITDRLNHVFKTTNTKVSKYIKTLFQDTPSLTLHYTPNLKTIFDREIGDIFTTVQKYDYITSTLNGQHDNELAQDIARILYIIQQLDDSHQKELMSQLNDIKQQYDLDICVNNDLDTLLLSIRKKLQPILEKLNKVTPFSITTKTILEDIQNTLHPTENHQVQAIESTVHDILQLLNDNAISEYYKIQIKQEIQRILQTWQDMIQQGKIDDTHSEHLSNLPNNLRLQLDILSDLYKLYFKTTTYIKNYQEYNEVTHNNSKI